MTSADKVRMKIAYEVADAQDHIIDLAKTVKDHAERIVRSMNDVFRLADDVLGDKEAFIPFPAEPWLGNSWSKLEQDIVKLDRWIHSYRQVKRLIQLHEELANIEEEG